MLLSDERIGTGSRARRLRRHRHRRRPSALRVAMLYDMDACHAPTGVTRHALAQLDRLARRPEIALTLLTGRMKHPDGLAFWESLELPSRRELPLRTRDLLRWWRVKPWPPIEWWTGPLDWIYCPAEFFVPAREARKAVTSHDVLQLLRYEPPRKRELMAQRLRAGRPGPVGLAVQHRAVAGGVPRLSGPGGLRTQRGRRPVLRAGPAARARPGPRRPGTSPRDAVPALGRQLPAAEEPGAAGQGGGAAPRGEPGRAGPGDRRHRRRGGGPPAPRGGRRGGPAGPDPDARLPPGPGALRRLCRGRRDGVPLALRELRHPGGRGDGAGASPSPWPTPPPCRRSAARPAGTSTRRPRTPSPTPSAACSTTPANATAASCSAGSIAGHYRWQAANDLLVDALVARHGRTG